MPTPGAKPQLKEIAVNPRGWCLEEPFPNHEPFELITALAWTSFNLKSGIKKHLKDHPNEALFRVETPDLELTAREKMEPQHDGQTQYRIVGYTFPDLPAEYIDRCPQWQPKSGGVGMVLPAQDRIIPWDNWDGQPQSPPVVVVSPVCGDPVKVMRFCGLICPRDGLCQPHVVRMGQVFFRAEYRDGSTSNMARDNNWTKIVSDKCASPAKRKASESEPNFPVFKRSRTGDELVLSSAHRPTKGDLNSSPSSSHPPDCAPVQDESPQNPSPQDPGQMPPRPVVDPGDQPLTQNAGLKAFLYSETFTDGEARQLVKDATAAWEAMPVLTADKVLFLRECIDAVVDRDDVEIRVRDLHAFLLDGCRHLDAIWVFRDKVRKASIGRRLVAKVQRTYRQR